MHTEKPIFTAQFHPEAFGGPTDTEVNFISCTQGWGLGIFGDSWWQCPYPYSLPYPGIAFFYQKLCLLLESELCF